MLMRLRRPAVLALLAAAAATQGSALARQQVAALPAATPAAIEAEGANAATWGGSIWQAAKAGDNAELARLLQAAADGRIPDAQGRVRDDAARLVAHFAQREENRAEQTKKTRDELDKLLAEPQDVKSVSKALREALDLQTLLPVPDPADREAAILDQPGIRDLVDRAKALMKTAEAEGDVLGATELCVLLDALMDVSGSFRPDARRLFLRQEMLRSYTPKRLWELTNERRIAWGEKPLEEFNPLIETLNKDRLTGVDATIILRALNYADEHVERIPMVELVKSGLEAVRTMLTTKDLALAFPGLADEKARTAMLAQVEKETAALDARQEKIDSFDVEQILNRLVERNAATTQIRKEAMQHEFGNGAMGRLDEYSAIIWPDEVRRFRKNTEGRFVGVGVQIEHDDERRVKVVTPLEGTPAQRAGIHPDDRITMVDDRSIFGLTLDQVVDVITGPEGTPVKLTVERPEKTDAPEEVAAGDAADAADAAEPMKTETLEFMLNRATVPVPTVRGWKRNLEDAREDSWDWFLDADSGLGYARVSQFAEKTTRELERAIAAMKKSPSGLNGLILDLRFNPGGLLDEAWNVGQRLLPVDNEPIVKSKGPGRQNPTTVQYTDASKCIVRDIPMIVLVNEGSASASEIVSGAVSVLARKHGLDALVLGARSYGKGSVQNVWPLPPSSMVKITTAYYTLPDDSMVHRRPGNRLWGLQPDLSIEMLPRQITDALQTRREADVLPLNEAGLAANVRPVKDADALILEGQDLQLEVAKVVMGAHIAGQTKAQASKDR